MAADRVRPVELGLLPQVALEHVRQCQGQVPGFAVVRVEIDGISGPAVAALGRERARAVLAERLRLQLRDVDLLCDCGDDGLAAVLVRLGAGDAQQVALRLRAAVTGHAVAVEWGRGLRVRVSIGVACADALQHDLSRLVREAGLALNRARVAGGSAVCLALTAAG